MKKALELDPALLAQAKKISGIKDDSELIHQALAALISMHARQQLIKLGGSDSKAKAPSRRRPS